MAGRDDAHREAQSDAVPRIFYWMLDGAAHPSGGEKHAYEHVDILNAAGFTAFAAHLVGVRHRWFDNDTRIVCGAAFWNLYDPRRDYIVVPEPLGPWIAALPGRKVIFNKNLYLGFQTFPPYGDLASSIYLARDVVAILAVSEHNCQHLRFAFPEAVIKRVYAGIDAELYAHRDMRLKKKQIAVVNKNLEETGLLMQMLRARASAGLNRLSEFQVTVLQDLTAAEAAMVMRDSPLLVSLSTREGLPRTILEAMACGCVVAAYGAGPLKEILPTAYAVEPGDLIGAAKHIESVMTDFPDRCDRWASAIECGRQTAAAFSRERQRRIVVEVWREIFAEQGDATRRPAVALEHDDTAGH